MAPNCELEAYEFLLCMHLQAFVGRLSQLAPEHWNWSPDPAAPTPHTLAVHAWQWLMCDRQHIREPDVARHIDVADAPTDTGQLCRAISEETEKWRKMLREMDPAELDRPLRQFGNPEVELNVRWFICHMIQNVIYKHGQFSEIYFTLGYDGKEPYAAPFPNPIYKQIRLLLAG